MSSKVAVEHDGRMRLVESFVDAPEKMVLKATLINLCKRVAAVLDRHYPGWLWAIRPDEGGGIVDIFSMRIDAEWGYTLHTARLQEDVDLRSVIVAGGEILERYGMPRGPYSYEAWKSGNWRFGRLVPKLTDKERQVQRTAFARSIRNGIESGHVKLLVEDGTNHLGAAIKAMEKRS